MQKLSFAVGSLALWSMLMLSAPAQPGGGDRANVGGQGGGQSGANINVGGASQGTGQGQRMSGQTSTGQSGGLMNQSAQQQTGGSPAYRTQRESSDQLRQSQQVMTGQSTQGQTQQDLEAQQQRNLRQNANQTEQFRSGQSVQSQSEAMQRFRDEQSAGRTNLQDGQSGRRFSFNERPEFRDSLGRSGYPLDDWRVVNYNGGYWYWTPNQTWLYYNNGDWVNWAPGIGIGIGIGRPIFPFGYPSHDWRLVNNGGRWWYWTPNQTWLYYDNGTWVDYQPGVQVQSNVASTVAYPAGYPQDQWRMVFHDGRWWYYSPDRAWLVFDGGQWTNFATRQSVGFRGIDAGTDGQFDGQRNSANRQDMNSTRIDEQQSQTFRQDSSTRINSGTGSTSAAGSVNSSATGAANLNSPMQSPQRPAASGQMGAGVQSSASGSTNVGAQQSASGTTSSGVSGGLGGAATSGTAAGGAGGSGAAGAGTSGGSR